MDGPAVRLLVDLIRDLEWAKSGPAVRIEPQLAWALFRTEAREFERVRVSALPAFRWAEAELEELSEALRGVLKAEGLASGSGLGLAVKNLASCESKLRHNLESSPEGAALRGFFSPDEALGHRDCSKNHPEVGKQLVRAAVRVSLAATRLRLSFEGAQPSSARAEPLSAPPTPLAPVRAASDPYMVAEIPRRRVCFQEHGDHIRYMGPRFTEAGRVERTPANRGRPEGALRQLGVLPDLVGDEAAQLLESIRDSLRFHWGSSGRITREHLSRWGTLCMAQPLRSYSDVLVERLRRMEMCLAEVRGPVAPRAGAAAPPSPLPAHPTWARLPSGDELGSWQDLGELVEPDPGPPPPTIDSHLVMSLVEALAQYTQPLGPPGLLDAPPVSGQTVDGMGYGRRYDTALTAFLWEAFLYLHPPAPPAPPVGARRSVLR